MYKNEKYCKINGTEEGVKKLLKTLEDAIYVQTLYVYFLRAIIFVNKCDILYRNM